MHLASDGIERPEDEAVRIRAIAAVGEGLLCPAGFVGGSQGGLPVEGQLIQIEQHVAVGSVVGPQAALFNQVDLGSVTHVRTMHIVPAPLVANAQASQHLTDRGRRYLVQPANALSDHDQLAPTLGVTETGRRTPNQVDHLGFSGFDTVRCSGKKRDLRPRPVATIVFACRVRS